MREAFFSEDADDVDCEDDDEGWLEAVDDVDVLAEDDDVELELAGCCEQAASIAQARAATQAATRILIAVFFMFFFLSSGAVHFQAEDGCPTVSRDLPGVYFKIARFLGVISPIIAQKRKDDMTKKPKNHLTRRADGLSKPRRN